MERKIPKNIRQIGNVSDSPKIYVEDYVDTFLNQLTKGREQEVVGAFLVGENVHMDEEEYIYIYGAIKMENLSLRGRDVLWGEETWTKGCQTCKQFFEQGELLGWFLACDEIGDEMPNNLQKIHQKYFSKENCLIALKSIREKEGKLYVYKLKNFLECAGYYIYYEKNLEMQNYMIASRRANGITPSEVVADHAAKNFRDLVQKKQQGEKEKGKIIHAASVVLVLVLVVMGVNAINNYEKIRGMTETFEESTEFLFAEEDKQPDEQQELQNESEPVTDEAEEPNEQADVQEDETDSAQEESVEVMADVLTEEDFYIVQKGDTLALISEKIYQNKEQVDAICKMNGLEDGNLIYIGQKLLLP